MEKKELKVSAIKNGTVIDHIPAKDLFKVIRILGLDRIDTPVTFGNNLDSQKFGKKAIIKVSDKFFEDKEINK
ncbi:MAG: aspartate carbamoyltransferase regulatory subunit, partial [Bacteroidales bacterium]|nr:aspartate carbamoyltransferase regulatory subunit [Bacteroidales bacterium]